MTNYLCKKLSHKT